MTGGPAKAAGFTLLEIMVALVVFGFLLIGLTQGIRFGLDAWDGQAALIGQRGDLDAVDTALRNLISPLDPGGGLDGATFIGRPHALAFTTELPAGASDLDDRHADVGLGVDSRHDLVMRFTPYLHAIRLAGAPAVRSDVLLPGVIQVDFFYWSQNGGWVTRWNQPAPPALVRIRFELAGHRNWPAIVVAPMRRPDQ